MRVKHPSHILGCAKLQSQIGAIAFKSTIEIFFLISDYQAFPKHRQHMTMTINYWLIILINCQELTIPEIDEFLKKKSVAGDLFFFAGEHPSLPPQPFHNVHCQTIITMIYQNSLIGTFQCMANTATECRVPIKLGFLAHPTQCSPPAPYRHCIQSNSTLMYICRHVHTCSPTEI